MSFQVGVNIIGLPIFEKHNFAETIISTSKFHK